MRAVDLILKKKYGGTLDPREVRFLVDGYVAGSVPDYQMAAFMMAVCWKGMGDAETVALTQSMLESGAQVRLDGIAGITVDKHSTGGVGDKTSLVLGPLVASCGLVLAKMSGRGLGHTGGTLDKLEALEGFRVDLSRDEFLKTVNDHGLAVVGQTGDLVPADKKMYALRDVTGTVDSIPLIAASIMSKKMAVHNQALVLDVKVGSGAFMKTLEDATALARQMVRIGLGMGRKVRAVLTDMDEPLGQWIGNAVEVQESIDTLQGRGPADLLEVVTALAAELLVMTGKAADGAAAATLLAKAISSGQAFERFTRMVVAQGGKPGCWERLPQARDREVYTSTRAGVLAGVDCEAIGRAAMKLGAGRETKDSVLDLSAGLRMRVRRGQSVEVGTPLVELVHNDPRRAAAARAELDGAFTFVPAGSVVTVAPLVQGIVTE